MRVLVANCSVEYAGRLGARLPAALRLILLKADGSIAVHADAKAYKPLNWMSPPCTVRDEGARLVASTPNGELLTIELHEIAHDFTIDLGEDPGLAKDGVEAELQELIAKRVGEIAGVEQLLRYQERLDLDANLAPTRGMFVATRIKPQAKVFAQSKGVECVEVDLDELRAGAPVDLRLF